MNKLKRYFLDNGYFLKDSFEDKSFHFEKKDGDWSKIVYINKYSKKYKVSIIEGLPNAIKTIDKVVDTYKDVIKIVS